MSMAPNITPDNVAKWMFDILSKEGELYQRDAVSAIRELFGAQFLTVNAAGNTVLSPKVTKAFEAITPMVVWEPAPVFLWRFRRKGDLPGREQGTRKASNGKSYSKTDITEEDFTKIITQNEEDINKLLGSQTLDLQSFSQQDLDQFNGFFRETEDSKGRDDNKQRRPLNPEDYPPLQ